MPKHIVNMPDFSRLIEKARKDKEIRAVILYGSYARSEDYRDIDICLITDENADVVKKPLDYMKEFDFDFHTYRELPLYIKVRVLEEGKILFARDEDELYDIAIETIRDFESFKSRYQEYLEGVIHG